MLYKENNPETYEERKLCCLLHLTSMKWKFDEKARHSGCVWISSNFYLMAAHEEKDKIKINGFYYNNRKHIFLICFFHFSSQTILGY